ncbi:cytochrome c oxidase subunit I+III [Halovenus aranensis]|uniref:Cytochrome c oxidase subunit I+III n=1 Tax=Halovenus aranensis TaxID=890420 RepID=A0A1G8VWG6_9EURY|nr:cbb3-type cytochrome c oxidase subunit I [Halovenus aranensis]SDJ69590.1 cytochrome c oxidase subunit I+III [Halovenus aranensis]
MGDLPPRSSVKRWLVTTNHKDIGILYLLTSVFFLVVAGVLALLIRIQLLQSGGTILSDAGYNQVVTSHGFLMIFWFLSPFAFGFANYFVPLQIGADDLAFPRLNAMSYWLYLFSGVLVLGSFFQGATFMGGWTAYAPLNVPSYIPDFGQVGSFATILALIAFIGSVTIGSVNFLTTIYRMRAKGLRMRDIPLFSISILVTVWMMLFAFAAYLAALIILSSDHLLHTSFFALETGSGPEATDSGSLLWTHIFWFFGHPEVYIVFFPALGVLGEMVQTFSGRRLVGRKWFIIAMALVGIQSFIVWMHHMFLTAISLEIKTVMMVTTVAISLPFDLMVFSLIYTMIKGKIRWKTPFLFSLGALVIFIIGGITGVFLGAIVLDYSFRGTYWVVAHFHYVMASSAVILIGAVYYWFPKMTGKMYNEFLGKVHFAMAFIGFNLLYFPMFIVWETPRRIFHYNSGFTMWHQTATAGAFLFAASFLVMFYNLAKSLYSDRHVGESPWSYVASPEWAVSSPPPLENFPGKPSFASGELNFLDRAETDGGVEDAATDGGVEETLAPPEEHADHASWWPFLTASSVVLTGFGLAGLSVSHFVWPFLFAIPAFVAALGVHGARQDGFAQIHGIYMMLSFPLLALFFIFFHIGIGIGELASMSAYFWAALVGAVWGAYTLAGIGYESFEVPEPKMAEQWPFESVENTKLGMWTFIASDIIVFGAFIGAYIFTRIEYGWQEWWKLAKDPAAHTMAEQALEHHPVLPGLINTYLLLASSFTVVLALSAARRTEDYSIGPFSISNRSATVTFLGLTFGGAAFFLVNKGIEWVDLFVHQGWTFGVDVMSSTFYLTTGMHALHVIIGMLVMLFLIARAWTGAYVGEGEDASTIEYFGLYWHFVDIVWLFLFPLFYIL